MICRFSSSTDVRDVVDGLNEAGVVIVEAVLSGREADQICEDLASSLGETPISGQVFTGRRAKTVDTVVKLSETYRRMLMSEIFSGVVGAMLGPNCNTWRLSASSAMSVHGGGDPQILHRDESLYGCYVDRSPEAPHYAISTILAVTDFTEENGATRFIPGSHRWPLDREADESQAVHATMKRGSLALYLGKTLHGLSVNRTDFARTGIITICSVGWLRQAENFYGSVPKEFAETYPVEIRRMLGWQAHNEFMGFIPGCDQNNQIKGLRD